MSMSSPPATGTVDSGNEETRELTHEHNVTPAIPDEQNPTSAFADTPPNPHSKPCTLCQRRRDVLIRCQIDETKKWHFVCTGKCWKEVSGGKTDAHGGGHPLYRYGGMWKNKHDAVSAKIKGKAKEDNKNRWGGCPAEHRRRGIKAWSKRVGKHSGEVKIKDDDGGSDIEVSELDDDDGVEYEGELLDGFEKDEPEGTHV
jgi:hypothetical protein